MAEPPRIVYLPHAVLRLGSRTWYIRSRFPLWAWLARRQVATSDRKERLPYGHRPR